MAFTLITEDVFYKEDTTYEEPYYLRGVYYEGSEITTYPTLSGTIEPYSAGEGAIMLPSGTRSSDAKILYTEEILNTYSDFGAESGMADKIYLVDPSIAKHPPQPYVVFEVDDWSVNSGFTLISSARSYLLIREGKLK